ncbi:hypothetical protein SAMN04487941_3512 [Pontibacter akesuensis]|uniref:Uncharacterized protein n=1 Tax=Pontibacter akesuensis TaxID=388950 RepID=A0A1I7K8F9_9BACT|nr:hypothetical protein SAMN04487941_3512 [Pontibacter akesuensis]
MVDKGHFYTSIHTVIHILNNSMYEMWMKNKGLPLKSAAGLL